MLRFDSINLEIFLKEYWQKKPIVLRNALPDFINPLMPDELAGLALEEDVESRIVKQHDNPSKPWELLRGPFSERDFQNLPKTHWTLLVQGVDRLIPEVYKLLESFDFIPQWRIDDVMISYASQYGSVGPHYDNYDVFLYQALGRREWSLTSQGCNSDNYIPNLELRIMNEFNTEEQFVLEEGDLLYLPPHIGHYGIALSAECMTYSFGYRSYSGHELLEHLSEYVAEQTLFKTLYQDPDWSELKNTSEIPPTAWQQAQHMLQQFIQNEEAMKAWFASFATHLDQTAEQQLPQPLSQSKKSLTQFLKKLTKSQGLTREACCRFAYVNCKHLYINGRARDTAHISEDLILLVANQRYLTIEKLRPYLNTPENQMFLFDLWIDRYLDF